MITRKNLLFYTIVISLGLLAGVVLLTLPIAVQAAPPLQAPVETPSATQGQLLWADNCLPCHGPTGRGDGPTAETIPGPLPNFADPQAARQYVPIEVFDVIKNGRMDKMMPPWKERLSDAEMWDAAAYVWRLGTSVQSLTAGETIYQENCVACHGDTGAGDGPDAPAEMVDLTDVQAMVQKSQADLFASYSAADAHAQLDTLSEDEVWQTLDYVRTFSFETTIPRLDGVLKGQVINGTTGKPVGNVEVTLHAVQNNTEIEARTVQADENGNFTFENLSTEHTVIYFLEGEYQNIRYTSAEPGIFTPDSTETTLNLNVYDTTTSPENVYISQLHYLIAFAPDVVQAVQIFVIGNSGDRTYVGENGQTVPFEIPANATNITFQNDPGGLRFVETDNGYVDTRPVQPGVESSSVVVLYDIPYSSDEAAIELPVPLKTEAVNVLMSSHGAILSSDQVQFVETRQVQGNEFAIYTGDGLNAGDVLTLRLSNLDKLDFGASAETPAVSTSSVDQGILRWLILGLGVLAVVVAGVGYPLLRRQVVPVVADDADRARQKLLLLLARLDDAFEAGELDEAVYRQARARYKAELARLMEV